MNSEIWGIAWIHGHLEVIAKASRIKDHGEPCWLCLTVAEHPRGEVVSNYGDVIEWMEKSGAQQIIEASEIN